jgi:hypothetical protein
MKCPECGESEAWKLVYAEHYEAIKEYDMFDNPLETYGEDGERTLGRVTCGVCGYELTYEEMLEFGDEYNTEVGYPL